MVKLISKVKNIYGQIAISARAALWFTISNLLIKGVNFLSVPLFTRLLSENEYGKLSLFMSYEQILIILATWEIQLGAYQKGIFKYKENVKDFTMTCQFLTSCLTGILFGLLFLAKNKVFDYTGFTNEILILLFVYIITLPAYSCWMIRKRTEYDYKSVIIATILYCLGNILFPIVTIFVLGNTAISKYCANLVFSSVFCMIFYLPNIRYHRIIKRINFAVSECKYMIKFEAPLVLHSLSFLVLSQADRVMIGRYVGNVQAAYYSVAYGLASVVTILQSSLNQALLPWRYQMLEEKKYASIRRVTNYLLLAIGIIILMFVLVAPEIMKLLFSKNYYEAVWSIPPVSISVYFMFLYTIFVNVESYFEKTKYVMYVSVFCGFINILLNFVLMNYFGYIACGYATLLSYVLFAIGHYYFTTKVIDEYIRDSNVFDSKVIAYISIGLIMMCVLITVLYPFTVIRYLILLLCCLGVLLKRKQIREIIIMIRGEK